MKILLIHNNYGKFNGKESVVKSTSHLFTNCGHEALKFT